jgi:riboflavin kinase/FMN adenylyltransferase
VSSRRFDGAQSVAARPGSALIVVGNFDGVHRGHRIVLSSAVERANERGLSPLVLTFDPHPAVVLRGVKSAVLTTMDRRIELIARIDPALSVVVEPFTPELSRLSARAFAEELLVRDLGAAVVVVGENFRFGRGREGDVAMLAELGTELGFAARPHVLEGDDNGRFSSTRVRTAISAGDVLEAERVLGRPHAISGTVASGDRRGRTLGFPTANLAAVPELLPPHGVYACLVDRLDADGGASRLGLAVTNIGTRPTFEGGLAVEAHLLDFSGDLYGARLRLHLVARLREERAFEGREALVEQIQRDVAAARQALASRARDPDAGGAWH